MNTNQNQDNNNVHLEIPKPYQSENDTDTSMDPPIDGVTAVRLKKASSDIDMDLLEKNQDMHYQLNKLRTNSMKFDQAVRSGVRCREFVMTRKTLFCIVVSVLVLTIGIVRLVLSEDNEKSANRTEAFHLGSQYGYTLERQLKTSIFSTHALKSYVMVDDHNVTESNFESIALSLLESFGGITNLQLAPNAIVQQIIPLAGNEAALGHDLLMDPNRRGGSLATIAAESVVFVGPLTLIQGGIAVIARNPVFTNFTQFPSGREQHFNSEGVKFWGFVTMLSLIDDLLAPVQLNTLEAAGYSWQLINTADNAKIRTFASSSNIGTDDNELRDPVEIDVAFSAAKVNWKLLVEPKNGWPEISGAFWQLIFLLSATTGFALWSIYRTLERESKLERVKTMSQELFPMMQQTITRISNESE